MRQARWVPVTLILALLVALLPTPAAAQKAGAALSGGAQFLPANTALYFALDTDSSSPQLQYVNRLVSYYTRGTSLEDLHEQMLESIPEADIRELVGDLHTWVGNELFVAIPDASGFQSLLTPPGTLMPGAGGPPGPRGPRGIQAQPMTFDVGVLAGVQIRDLAAFSRFVTRLHAHLAAENVPTTPDRYGNTDILVINAHDETAYFAMNRGYLLFSNNRDTLTSALDQSFGASLAANPSFQNATSAFFGRSLAFWYANDPYRSFGFTDSELFAGYPVPPLRWAAGVLQLDASSIRVESTAEYDPAGLTPAMAAMLRQRPNPLRSANVAPADSVFYIGLDNVKQIWDQLNELPGEFRDELQSFRFQFRAATGLDLDQDVFGWMTGELGIFVGPTAEDDEVFRNIGIGLVIEAQDPAAVSQRLDRIVNAVQRLAGPDGSLESVDVGGVSFTHVTLEGDTGIYCGVAGNWAVFTTSPSMADDVVANTRGQTGLSATPEFGYVRTALPSQVQGMEYVNTPGLVDLIVNLAEPSPRERAEAAYYTAPIRGIGISSSVSGVRVNSTIFVHIVLP